MDLKQYEGTLAIATPHNQWLDATARSGLVCALAIVWAFGYVVWPISYRLALTLLVSLMIGYWAIAVTLGFTSQFDDERWLYHIPYLALFFIPVVAATIRACAEQPAHASEDAQC
jgi:O-antigen ligase